MPTRYDHGYDCKELPDVRCIKRFMPYDELPQLPKNKKIAVFIGSHEIIDKELEQTIDAFCETNNAVIFCEHTSGYSGKYGVKFYQALCQQQGNWSALCPDIVIDMGEIASIWRVKGHKTWRLSEDGELKDPHKNLENVFEMTDSQFFTYYSKGQKIETSYFDKIKSYLEEIKKINVELPFSNLYAASKLHSLIPNNSIMHFGILNSSRVWNLFELPENVKGFCNVGGYGIDGGVSSLLGASFLHPEKLYFGVFGDLCFFYDMNALGNRLLGNNLRILLVNNGLGEEFKTFFSHTYQWKNEANSYVAAEGHFGRKSPLLVKHYVEDLGFEYICASNIDEFEKVYKRFVEPTITEKPIFFEIFTNDENENEALYRMMNKYVTAQGSAKTLAKQMLGEKGTKFIKNLLGK